MTVALCALAACRAQAADDGYRVAVLQNGQGKHDEEFKTAFKELGIEPAVFKDTPESMAAFFARIDDFELVLVAPLFNLSAGLVGQVDMAPLARYLEKGGMIVVTDATYPGVRTLLEPVLPGLATIKGGGCTSSQWQVNGYVRNVAPVHPVRSFPNVVTDPDGWPHFTSQPAGWTLLATCSEGEPVIFFRAFGKGCAVVTAIRQQNPRAIEAYCVYSRLRRSGLDAATLALTPLAPGDGTLTLTLASPPPDGASLKLEVRNAAGDSVSFATNLAGSACSLPFNIPYRGPVEVSVAVVTPAGGTPFFRRSLEMPPLMRVGPNAYRGILSTARRLPDVQFPVRLAPDKERLEGARITLAVFGPDSNKVASATHTLPTNGVPRQFWIPVALDRSLPPGAYRVDAEMEDPPAFSSAPFEILAPDVAQAVIDEDGTFLVNGRPFFPLGIYHTRPEAYAEIADIGFNAQQFWKWSAGNDAYGAPINLHRASAHGLRCLFESNHGGRGIYRACAELYAAHPAILMWYVRDEPAEGDEAEMAERNDEWHASDKNHPTYIASCRPDLFAHHAEYADVLGFDPYGTLGKVVDWCRRAERAVGGHKATVCVPWADAQDVRLIRAMAYVAVAHNVRGIIWYCWNQTGGGPAGVGIHDKPKAKAEYRRVLAELRHAMPGLTSVTRRPFEEGPVHGIVLGDPDAEGRRYLLLVNTADAPVEADFAVPELARQTTVFEPFPSAAGQAGGEGARDGAAPEAVRTLEAGRVRHAFEPYGTLMYRW